MYNIRRLLILISPLLLMSLLLTGCSNERRSSRYLIPSGYVGPIRIDYGVAGASPLPLEQEFFLFRFPATGHLQTSTAFESGVGTDEFYYVTGNRRQRLYGEHDGYPTGSQPPTPMIWGGSVGSGSSSPVHEMYFIGTEKQYKEFCNKHPYWKESSDFPPR